MCHDEYEILLRSAPRLLLAIGQPHTHISDNLWARSIKTLRAKYFRLYCKGQIQLRTNRHPCTFRKEFPTSKINVNREKRWSTDLVLNFQLCNSKAIYPNEKYALLIQITYCQGDLDLS